MQRTGSSDCTLWLARLMKYKLFGPTTGSTLPGGSYVGTLGRLEQLAVRGCVGVGLAIYVFGVIVGYQVVDVLVVGRVHVWVRRRYQVVPLVEF